MIKKLAIALAMTLAALSIAAAPASAATPGVRVWCISNLSFRPSGITNALATRGHMYRNAGGRNYWTVCDGHRHKVLPFLRNGCDLPISDTFTMPRENGDNREHTTWVNLCFS